MGPIKAKPISMIIPPRREKPRQQKPLTKEEAEQQRAERQRRASYEAIRRTQRGKEGMVDPERRTKHKNDPQRKDKGKGPATGSGESEDEPLPKKSSAGFEETIKALDEFLKQGEERERKKRKLEEAIPQQEPPVAEGPLGSFSPITSSQVKDWLETPPHQTSEGTASTMEVDKPEEVKKDQQEEEIKDKPDQQKEELPQKEEDLKKPEEQQKEEEVKPPAEFIWDPEEQERLAKAAEEKAKSEEAAKVAAADLEEQKAKEKAKRKLDAATQQEEAPKTQAKGAETVEIETPLGGKLIVDVLPPLPKLPIDPFVLRKIKKEKDSPIQLIDLEKEGEVEGSSKDPTGIILAPKPPVQEGKQEAGSSKEHEQKASQEDFVPSEESSGEEDPEADVAYHLNKMASQMGKIYRMDKAKDTEIESLMITTESYEKIMHGQQVNIEKLQKKAAIQESLFEAERLRSKEFSDRLNEMTQRAIKAEKEKATAEAQTNAMRAALQVANDRRQAAEETLNIHHLDFLVFLCKS